MQSRRSFLKYTVSGLAALGAGLREALAQPAAAVRRFLMGSPPGTETTISGRRYLYFGGTSYHTLQYHPEVIRAAHEALDRYGIHSSTSRSGFGNTPLYAEVERMAARFFGTEDAAYLASGYLSNIAALQVLRLRKRYDAIFHDETAHYSIADFVHATNTPVHVFAHRDPDDLSRQLKAGLKPGQTPLVMTDGIFPVPGEIAPVPDYVKALEPYNGLVWLDDAHALGVIGANGRGTYEQFGLSGDRLFFGGTLSKALGGYGGIVPASAAMAQDIRDGHIMNGATMPASPSAAASVKGMELLLSHPEWLTRLRENARRLKAGIRQMGFTVQPTDVPVVSFALKTASDMERVHAALMDRGICIQLSHYVGAGEAGVLRIVVFSTHTGEQIDRLLGTLNALV
jgi:7-keto-8-aminopelargonate synthetase-like enzyme